MLDTAAFVERAERETGQTVRASCEARWRRADAVIGKAGLLCATDDGLVFVEDAILEPGAVSATPREAIRDARLERGVIDTTLVVDTADGPVHFDNIAHDDAQQLASAAGLTITTPGSSDAPPPVPEPVSAPSLEVDPPKPPEAVAAADPVSARSEELFSEELSAHLATARRAPADEPPSGQRVVTTLTRRDPFESAGQPGGTDRDGRVEDQPATRGRTPSRKRRKRRSGKSAKDKVGPYGWLGPLVAVGLAFAGMLYHWSVAVLLGCIGYVAGLYLAEHMNQKRLRDGR